MCSVATVVMHCILLLMVFGKNYLYDITATLRELVDELEILILFQC